MRFAAPASHVTAGVGSVGSILARSFAVTPAEAGVQRLSRTLAVESLDPRFRGDDKGRSCLSGYTFAPAGRDGAQRRDGPFADLPGVVYFAKGAP